MKTKHKTSHRMIMIRLFNYAYNLIIATMLVLIFYMILR